jgi:hypothetical protein
MVGMVAAAPPAAAAIDLVWEPAEQTVSPGDTVEINLVARSDDASTQHFALLDAIIIWDPAYLDFLGVDDTEAGYPFLASHFMPDPDGLNDDLQDGDALFIALAPGGQEAPVPPEGLVITQFEFTALAVTDGTDVSIVATMGTHARTRIRRLDLTDVTGEFAEPGVVIIRICGTGDADGDGDVDLEDFAAFQRCFTGDGIPATSDCQCHFDFDEDTDVDLSDYWEFEQRLTGPLP